MGYLTCNGVIWTRLSHFDFEESADGEIRRIHTLNEKIRDEVVHKKREIFVTRMPFRAEHERKIGLRGLSCGIDTICEIHTGFYDAREDKAQACWYSGQITDCSAFVQSKTRIIQKLFRRRRRPFYLQNIRNIKAFQDAVSCWPTDVVKRIAESYVESQNTSIPRTAMLTVETELFKQVALRAV
jgi:hypothetical protein